MWRSSRSFHKLLLHGGAHSIVAIPILSLMSDRASEALVAASLLAILEYTMPNQYCIEINVCLRCRLRCPRIS